MKSPKSKFLKYLILRDSYFHRKLSCVKINITLESSSLGNHSLHRREENSMKENKKSVSTRRASSHCKASKANQEDFIMLPTVDFCFKEFLMSRSIQRLPGSYFRRIRIQDRVLCVQSFGKVRCINGWESLESIRWHMHIIRMIL